MFNVNLKDKAVWFSALLLLWEKLSEGWMMFQEESMEERPKPKIIGLTIVLFLFSTLFSPLISQTKIDSLKIQFSKDSVHIYRVMKVLPAVAIDQRNSFLGKTKINISGFQVGVNLYEKHTVGLGFYSILAGKRNTRLIGDKKQTFNQNLELKYITVFYHYPVVNKKHFELGFPVEAGLGYFTVNVTDSTGASLKGFPKPKAPLLVFGGGFRVSVKPVRWVGVHVIGGYRIVKDNATKLNFNGPFYAFGLQLYIHQIIQDTEYFIKRSKYKSEMNKLYTSIQ